MRILLVENLLCVPTYGGANKANQLILEGLTQRRHICQIIARSTSTGEPAEREQFLELLAERGLAVASDARADVFTQAGVEYHAAADATRMRDVLLRQIRAFEPDWVLVSSEDSGQSLLEAALHAAPGRVVYVAHTPQMFPFGPDSCVPSAAGTRLVQQVAGVIALGTRTAALVQQCTGLQPAIIHPPIYGQPPFPDYGSFDSGWITLVNPSAAKGISIFLALAARFPEQQFAAVLAWSTTAQDQRALARLPNVQCWPPTSNMDSVFARTRVLLVPSLYQEGFGVITVEAMLRGIPVLASDYGGLVDAKLGVDYLLPIRPIAGYEARYDARGYPVPVIPEQDLAPWQAAVEGLLTRREEYVRVSQASRAAAASFVAALAIAPFEQLLLGLAPDRGARASSGSAQGAPDEPAIRARLQSLSPERRALLALRSQQRAATATPRAIPAQPRNADETIFPLSFSQERLWVLNALQPDSVAYNDPIALRLNGALDRAALERSLLLLVQRHEALRTTFRIVDGQPAQVIARAQPIALPTDDLRQLPGTAQEAELLALAAAEADAAFDLGRGPLFRCRLLQLAADSYVLLLTLHHIVSDGWSWSIVFRELSALYRATVLAQPARLPALPIQYADYTVWQRAELKDGELEAQRAYWRRTLADLPALNLPLDHPRPAVFSARGAIHTFTLASELNDALATLAQREGITLFSTLLAGWSILLARYSEQRDIAIGIPVASRSRSEIEGLIGFFTNTLVLRVQLATAASARELLRQVHGGALDAYAQQDLPFVQIVDAVQPERDLGRHPLFQVMVTFENEPLAAPQLVGLASSLLRLPVHTSKFDLTLMLEAQQDGLRVDLEYCTDLFDAPTIERMAAHFRMILAGIVADAEQRWPQLPLLAADEREQLLYAWNPPPHMPTPTVCLHERFATHAARRPQAIALVYETKDGGRRTNRSDSSFSLQPSAFSLQLTYAELDARANQLAQVLHTRGVGPELRVAIYLERSFDLVVAILGILKAGGAYVAIDPAYPAPRVSFIIEDARATVLLTQRDLLGQLALPETTQAICLDADAPMIAEASTAAAPSRAVPDNLAYVIYTSGSTGTPKGSLISHANADRLLTATDAWFHFDERDVWTLFHSAAFDFSVWELWGALAFGGKLVVVPYWVSRSPETFYELLRVEQVTVLNQTPSAFQQLIQLDSSAQQADDLALRLVIFGGEALHLPSLRPWFARHGDQHPQLVNMYGITETTVHVTYRPLVVADAQADSGSMIGVPIPDLQLYVLDAEQQPVPIGVPGELYVGGAGLARGYLHRPDLTAERFVPNPFLSHPFPPAGGGAAGGVLYKTGDRVRRHSSGDLEYLGRGDQQIKLRGFRIELGEIMALLRAHPAVLDALVLLRGTGDAQRLVAYVVPMMDHRRGAIYCAPTTGGVPTPDPRSLIPELRAFVRAQLPEYMLPADFVLLDAFPLTVNGKLDVAALPAPSRAQDDVAVFSAPQTPAELVVAQVWTELLGLETIGCDESFFDVGGNSLLATQVVNQLHSIFQVSVPLRQFFSAPTVAGLIAELVRLHGDEEIVDAIATAFQMVEQLSDEQVRAMMAVGG